MSNNLSELYSRIKAEIDPPAVKNGQFLNVGSPKMLNSPGAMTYRTQAVKQSNHLKDECAKRILVDIYCHILPLDHDHITGDQKMIKSDIDNFLSKKDMSASQYLTSCYEATRAPLLEFILRSCDNIGKEFIRESEETLRDAQEKNIKVPPPVADSESEEVDSQLIEVENDSEYESFISKLKKKTIDKIVGDISKIISDKKSEKDMSFDLKPNDIKTESTVSVAIDYIHEKLWKENVTFTETQQDEIMGLAIREATLNQLDIVFQQPQSELNHFKTKIGFNQGIVVNESVITNFI